MANPNRYTCDLLIIDGRHLLYRSADVNRSLTAEVDGETLPAGGVYGFLNVLTKVKRRYQGIVVVAWEGKNNFRFKLYPEYKRKPEPEPEMKRFYEELGLQERMLVDILSKLGVRQYRGVECEADDVIGTLVTDRPAETRIAIFSGDSDLRQLVRGVDIVVLAPGKKGIETKYDHGAVIDKHGVWPSQIPDLKALAGDGSDNIPGVRGIGEKGAASMLREYGNLEAIIEAAAQPEWKFTKRQAGLISEAAGQLPLFKQLTTIKRDVKLIPHPTEPNKMEARRLMARLQFKRLLEAGSFADLARLGR